MTRYQVSIARNAEKEFLSLPGRIQALLKDRLLKLQTNPRSDQTKKLRDSDKYRLRMGNYRVIYSINGSVHIVVVLSIGHRKEIYR